MIRALLAAGFLWCNGASDRTVTAPEKPASPAPTPASAVTDVASARAGVGQHVKVMGTAGNAKLAAAVILTDGTPVYCLGTSSWPRDIAGTPIAVEGTLELTDEFATGATRPAGPVSAGTGGPVWVLRDCKVAAHGAESAQ